MIVHQQRSQALFAGGHPAQGLADPDDEMTQRVRTFDWSSTPLGPAAAWPPSLETLVSLLLASNQPMFLAWGPDRTWIYNDAFKPIMGRKHPALGLPAMAVWAEASAELEPMFERVFGGESINMTGFEVGLDRSGKVEQARFDFSYTPARDESGAVAGLFGVCVETTEIAHAQKRRAKAEAALRASEERYRSLFESMDEAFCVIEYLPCAMGLNDDFRYVVVNPAFSTATGVGEVVGSTIRAIIPLEAQEWIDIYARVVRTGEPIRFERRLVSHHRVLELYAYRVDPVRHRVAVIFSDATQRRADEELARSIRERDRVWRNTPDLLVSVAQHGICRAANPGWKKILGFEPEEIEGQSYRDFVWPEDAPLAEAAYATAWSANNLANFEIRCRHRDGTPRWISWNTSRDGDLLFGFGRDVTREIEARAQLAEAQDALRQAQKMEAVGQLTGGIAHDFNNMLAGISGNIELLGKKLKASGAGDLAHYVDDAIGAVRRASALTHRLLAFSRRQTLDPRPVAVNAMVGSIEDLLRRTLGPDIELSTFLDDKLWVSLCDPNQLENALLNLAINSRDAMPAGGKLSVKTANVALVRGSLSASPDVEPGEFVHIEVTDTGLGMSCETLSRALDPFFTTKPIGRGTGLGLSMVYGFVKQSKGHVRMESEPGAGTSVHLYLPRLMQYPPDRSAEEDCATIAVPHLSRVVLLVEDDIVIRQVAAEILSEVGLTVHEASDAHEALTRFSSLPQPDLLITDVGLPNGMNGRQLADALRERAPALKVLFITGYAPAAVFGEGMLESGMQVLTKPYSLDAFASKVAGMIEAA
jgi:PAS domain S-box-containing protein